MLYIILISLLVIFTVIFVLPTIFFYILFKTKYKTMLDSGSLSDIINMWMNKFSANLGSSYANENQQNVFSSKMAVDEALEVLNLRRNPYPTKKEINDAYYKLIQKLHPDKGGSDYLAKKLNEAREVLLNTKH